MTELLTAAQMRAIEQAAIASGEVTGLELMERAGRGVVEAILDWRPELAKTAHRAVVLCGPGNNGGDGFVVARLLKERGWEVEVFLYGEEGKLPPDAAENARRWREMGEILLLTSTETQAEFGLRLRKMEEADLVADAIFGIGLTRGFEPPQSVNHFFHRRMCDDFWWFGEITRPYVVALDCPSEIDSNSGRTLEHSGMYGGEMGAHLTVTFHRAKVGHYLGDGASCCGELCVVDIGLGDLSGSQLAGAGRSANNLIELLHGRMGGSASTKMALLRSHHGSQHKYDHGHALVLSGGPSRGGAARLAARGALRMGAGLVTVGSPSAALHENAATLDAIMLAPVEGVEGLKAELKDRKIKAVCIGPGFGNGERMRRFVEVVTGGRSAHPTEEARRAVVLDADALTEYRDDPETLFSLLHDRCVLTPHEGEFGRLFPDILAKLKEPATKGPAYSKVDATREAAARAGCVVLFKGADTVIAAPDGRCAINSAHYDRAAPWLATAGSGDVLAGFITGLLARGLPPMAAAKTAAWLHVECALKFGPGLIAEDLPEQLPAVFRDLGL